MSHQGTARRRARQEDAAGPRQTTDGPAARGPRSTDWTTFWLIIGASLVLLLAGVAHSARHCR